MRGWRTMPVRRMLGGLAAGALLALWLAGASLFIVYPWESALVLQFGEVVAARKEPGLYLKAPWQNLRRFDSRVLTIDSEESDRYITTEKENVLVDSYIKWRIVDPALYYIRLAGLEANATGRLREIINRGLRDEIGKRTVKEVVAGDREALMGVMRTRASDTAAEVGVEVVDVRLKRVNLPAGVSENVYKNMIEERRRIANERRATGDAEKEKIQASADRERTILLAEAIRDAERTRGEGEAETAAIYAGAYGSRPEFYDFYRSLGAYRRTLGNAGDFFLLAPDSDFFRYLKSEGDVPADLRRDAAAAGSSGSKSESGGGGIRRAGPRAGLRLRASSGGGSGGRGDDLAGAFHGDIFADCVPGGLVHDGVSVPCSPLPGVAGGHAPGPVALHWPGGVLRGPADNVQRAADSHVRGLGRQRGVSESRPAGTRGPDAPSSAHINAKRE